MINVSMTVREAVWLANKAESGDLYDRIIRAIEIATGDIKLLVACDGVNYTGQFWSDKIAAIRAVRNATRCGLKEAKEWIEDAQFNSKTIFTGALDKEVAEKLCGDLKKCGCSCWTVNS